MLGLAFGRGVVGLVAESVAEVGEEGIDDGDDEEGEQGAGGHAADDGEPHGAAAFGTGAEADGDGEDAGDGGEGSHEDGAEAYESGLEHGLAWGCALFALLVGELDEEDGVFGDHTDEEYESDLAEEVDIHGGDWGPESFLSPEVEEVDQAEGSGTREGEGEHDREGVDEAFELGGEHHVDDDDGEAEDPPELVLSIEEVTRFAGPGVEEVGGERLSEVGFDLLDGGAEGDADWCGGESGAAEPVVMFDGIGGGSGVMGDDTAELDENTAVVADVDAIEVMRGEAGGALELGDDIVFLAFLLNAAEVEAAEEDLESAGDIGDGDAEGGCAVAVDIDAELGFSDFVGGADIDEESVGSELVAEVLGSGIEGIEVLVLDDELEGGAEAAADGFRYIGDDEGAFDAGHELHSQAGGAVDNLLDGPVAFRFEANEGDTLVGEAGAGEGGCDDGAQGADLRGLTDDGFHLADHTVGVFAGGAFWCDGEADEESPVFFGEEVLVELAVGEDHGGGGGEADAEDGEAVVERPLQCAAVELVDGVEGVFEAGEQPSVLLGFGGFEDAGSHHGGERERDEGGDDD